MIKSRNPKYVKTLEKTFGSLLSRLPITPNQWTVASLILGIFGMIGVILYNDLPIAIIFFFFAFLADYFDGAVARYINRTTILGAYLDGVSDRFVEAIIIISLMFYGIPNVLIDSKISMAILLFLSTMTSYVRAYADHKKIVTDKNKLSAMGGLLERSERATILFLSLLASLIYGRVVISYVVMLLILLSFITILQRIMFSIREVNK